MTKFKKTTAILAIVCLCMSGIFSKAQAKVPRTLDGKDSRFTCSDEQMWNPTSQSLLSDAVADEWQLENTEVTLADNIFYYKQVKLCFPAGAGTISVMGKPEEPDPADIIVEPYLMLDLKQYPSGLLPACFITPFPDLSRQ